MSARGTDRAAAGAGAGAAVALGLAFALACRLDGAPLAGPAGGGGEGLLGRGLASARALLAESLVGQADRFFHRGVEHKADLAFRDPHRRLAEALVPRTQAHAADRGLRELMPWLRFAVDADPRRVDAWLVAAFWLDRSGAPAAEVDAVYREARLANPGDYRVLLDWGRFAGRGGRVAEAVRLLETARRVWPRGGADAKTAEADRAAASVWLGHLYAVGGRAADARAAFADAAAVHPTEAIRAALGELDAGRCDRGVWAARLASLGTPVPVDVCTQEDGAGAEPREAADGGRRP